MADNGRQSGGGGGLGVTWRIIGSILFISSGG